MIIDKIIYKVQDHTVLRSVRVPGADRYFTLVLEERDQLKRELKELLEEKYGLDRDGEERG